MRWPSRAASMNRIWCIISSRPRGESRSTFGASGSSMVAAWPPDPISNDLNSGPRSSQFASRRTGTGGAGGFEKSGARNGFASCRDRTDAGMTWFSPSSGRASGSRVMMSSSGLSSAPDSRSQSRRNRCATVEIEASGSSRAMRLVSRAAVLARICAMPSRRLRSSARAASATSGSAFTRARSSRIRSAMTWNFVRFVGPSLPFCALVSTSRTLRARIGMMGASSSRDRVRCRCLVWAMVLPLSGRLRLAPLVTGGGGRDRSGRLGGRRTRYAESRTEQHASRAHAVGRRTDSSGALPF